MNYIPNDRKKKDRLERLVVEMRRLIARGAPPKALLVAANEIRDARVRVLRLKQSRTSRDAPHYNKLIAAIGAAQATTAEAVLAEFTHRPVQ